VTLSNGTSDGTTRWGILGAGFIAGLQTQDLNENGFAVHAVGSRSLDSNKAFAEQYGVATAHGSYEDLVSDPLVAVVYVATPHPFHHANALLALNAGKDVLVEKSFTMNAREAQDIVDLAESIGLVALEAIWTRFLPHMVRIREVIQEDSIGEVRKAVAGHNQSLPKDPAHPLNDAALGGGALLDPGIYPISFAFDILGTPETIRASASMSATGVDRQTAAILEYANGQQAIVDCELDAASTNRAMVTGTEGWIDIEDTWYNPMPFTVHSVAGSVVERYEQPVNGRGMQYQAAELERLVRAGDIAGPILPPGESVAIITVMDEIRKQIGLTYEADAAVGGK
jgi:predicted dehydrogenase